MECVVCHSEFPAKRSTARYCSRRCSKRAQRLGIASARVPVTATKIQPAAVPTRQRKPSVADLTRLVVDAASLEAAFRFASERADYRYRPMCARMAHAIGSALDDEGLR